MYRGSQPLLSPAAPGGPTLAILSQSSTRFSERENGATVGDGIAAKQTADAQQSRSDRQHDPSHWRLGPLGIGEFVKDPEQH